MITKRPIFWSILFVWIAGCSTPEDPDAVVPSDKLTLIVQNSRNQLKADGKDRVYLLARVPEEAGEVDVTFTTTGGTFVFSGAATQKDYADSTDGTYRYATALLKADTLPRVVYVTAEIAKARNRIELTFIK